MMDAAVQTDIGLLWDGVKPRVADTWPSLTRTDLSRLEGPWDEVVTSIKLSTGESIASIEAKLEQIVVEARTAA
jgi:hypothetical protein